MHNSKQRGVFTVSMEFLARLMHFPEGHTIVDVKGDFARDQFDVLVEGPTLPVTSRNELTPRVQYICTQTDDVTNLVPERKIEGKFEA